MFPIVRSHPAYQAFVHEHLRRHYAPGTLQFVAPDWALVAKFWRTDLSLAISLGQDLDSP